MSNEEPDRRTVPVFVYGTLKPGELYWNRIAALVAWYEPAAVRGTLYDTGLGYPAAVFGGEDTVSGVVVYLRDAMAAEAIDAIDALEDEGTEYRRLTVRTTDGLEVLAYEWLWPVSGLAELPDGWHAGFPGT